MTAHAITHRASPAIYTVTCSCGWRFETKRRQNAWARAAKVKAAVNAHFAAVKVPA